MDQRIVTLRDLKVHLGAGPRQFSIALKALTIRTGDRWAIIGPSGCGKSTLLEALALIRRPHTTRSLEFIVNSEKVDILELWERQRHRDLDELRSQFLSYAPQRGGYFPPISVLGNLNFKAAMSRSGSTLSRDNFLALAGTFGLTETELRAKPDYLSSGERQRFVLIQMLVNRPRLLIADEPISALHPSQSERTLRLLSTHAGKYDAGLIIATHNVDLVRRLGFKCIVARPSEIDGCSHTDFHAELP